MTTLSETAYPRLKANPSAKELQEVYTPTEAEWAFVKQTVQRPLSRLAVLIHLKLFQRLGYFTTLAEVPEVIKTYIGKEVGYLKLPSGEQLAQYDSSGAKRAHIAALREYFNVKPLDSAGRTWLRSVAEDASEVKNSIPDIINVMLEELVHHRFELPGFSTLVRIAQQARDVVNDGFFDDLTNSLSPEAKKLIDELLKVQASNTHSGWQTLKREPKKPTNKEVREYLQHIRYLRHLVDQLPAVMVPVPKLRYFREMARAMNAAQLSELKSIKRYALAIVFIRAQYGQTLDDAADMFIRMLQNMENSAQQKLVDYQLEHSKRADMLISQLKDVLEAYCLDGADTQKLDAISNVLVTTPELLLAECEEHMAYAGKNHLPFLLQPYQNQRALLFNCLEIMGLHSTSQDTSSERWITKLLSWRSIRATYIDADEHGIDRSEDLGWLSGHWRKQVVVKPAGVTAEKLHRKFLELAILYLVKDEIKSGDLCIRDSERYDDHREQLVDEETFTAELV